MLHQDDYDYDLEDPHTTALNDDYEVEGYLTPDYYWKSTFPTGSGAGETTYGVCSEWEEYDNEVDKEDDECLAAESAYLTQNIGAVDCYLASSSSALTYATVTSGHAGNQQTQSYNHYGYHFTCRIPPRFDGNDLNNWIKAVRYWMDISSLQDKNKVPAIVNNLVGLATRWQETLNSNIPLLQSSAGLDHCIEIFKTGHIKPGFGLFLKKSVVWESFCHKPQETMTVWGERFVRFVDSYRDSYSSAIIIEYKKGSPEWEKLKGEALLAHDETKSETTFFLYSEIDEMDDFEVREEAWKQWNDLTTELE